MEMYIIALVILAALAVSDLIVGVSNDAVNFLNSAVGSRVAPRYVIMIIASLGMLAGVLFSKGMMEVARKGIFHPKFFTMPELMVIFLAVMLTDVLLLDLYNTFGLPTSTTVSIVFELLGAAVAVSLVKMSRAGEGFASLVKYINTGKALAIISGILLSVVVAFISGAILQFLTRLLFTFEFGKRLKRYGAIWGGLALSSITYFILIKGAKGSTFITSDVLSWIKTNTWLILLISFAACTLFLQLIMWFSKLNILKPIVLVGTFALAMAFAANDLVNFIGVPLAGWNAFQVAELGTNPLTMTMHQLQKATPSNTLMLLIAGIIMAVTLWFSRKAQTVTATEVNLGRQEEGYERFGSSPLARTVVRMVSSLGSGMKKIIPDPVMVKLNKRFDQTAYESQALKEDEKPSFDLVRASVNLMVAGALISLATSMKLPLSTTYVTFMVAMGTSFSDRAWGRDSAVYRVTGVLTVIGGWFLTALMAFTVSSVFAVVISYLGAPGVVGILLLGLFIIVRNRRVHKEREKEVDEFEIFNLKKVKDGQYAINTTFEHTGRYLKEVAKSMATGYQGLSSQNRAQLKINRKGTKKIQKWANIIVANFFKTLRLLNREEVTTTQKYANAVDALQEISECHRDLIIRAYEHIDNNHKGMLPVQLDELEQIKDQLVRFLDNAADALMKKELPDIDSFENDSKKLLKMIKSFDQNQIRRIQDDTSKTRLSILFYGFSRDSRIITQQTLNLLKIYRESFALDD